MGYPAPAHPGPYTVYDLVDMPDDGNRYEVIDGQLIVSPSPTGLHQIVVFGITYLLKEAAPLGLSAFPGIAVRCGEDDRGPIPDVVVTTVNPVTAGHIVEASEVRAVIEVVSPSTRTTDRRNKPDIYAAAGIDTYWRVETDRFRGQLPGEQLPVVFIYQRDGSEYQLASRCAAGSISHTTVPYPLEFDPQTWIDSYRT